MLYQFEIFLTLNYTWYLPGFLRPTSYLPLVILSPFLTRKVFHWIGINLRKVPLSARDVSQAPAFRIEPTTFKSCCAWTDSKSLYMKNYRSKKVCFVRKILRLSCTKLFCSFLGCEKKSKPKISYFLQKEKEAALLVLSENANSICW